MNSRIRSLLTFVVILCSAALAVVGGIRLIVPGSLGWMADVAPGLAGRVLPEVIDAALGQAVGLAGIALGLMWHAAARAGRSPASLRAATVIVAVGMILLTPGGLIPFAGYTFAMVVIVGVAVLTVLLVRRHPWRGVVAIAVVAAVATWTIVRLNAAEVASRFGPAFMEQLPGVLYAGAHLVAAVGLIASSVVARNHRNAFAIWVLRHRTAVTVVAACCALPYTIARASWLTPWPLLAPSGLDFTEDPGTLFTGLSLGAAMLAGGLLTLGLILPWGWRFPRWMAGLGGRPVPVALVVVPASVIAALFTVGGIDMILSVIEGTLSDGSFGQILEFVLAFPFWLWGPLLALATWGYAMARRDQANVGDSFSRAGSRTNAA